MDDYSLLNVTTIFDNDGKELKVIKYWPRKRKSSNFKYTSELNEAGWFSHEKCITRTETSKSLLEKDLYCGFTDNAINISGKVILPIFSKGWSHNDCHFVLTEGHERNILGNDNLPKVGIEVSQKYFPHFQTNKQCNSINSISPTDKDSEILNISKTFK